MAKFKVVVTDYEYESLENEKRELEKVGAELVAVQLRYAQPEEIIKVCKDADGLIVQYAKITREVIEGLEKCKVIARYGIGVDNVDVKAATEKGIFVVNVPDYCIEEVSDHTIALLLASIRKINLYDKSVKSGTWDYKIGRPMYRIKGKTLGLIGFGKLARRVAEKMKPFRVEIIAYDPYVSPKVAEKYGIKLVDFDELLKNSDFISIHVPLTEETYHLLSDREFELMKDGVIIVNTARGPIIDEKALVKALESGKIAYAGLDVTEVEPIPSDSPLLKFDNVIITPHVAWYSEESQAELQTKAARGVAEVLSGKIPTYLVNPEVLEVIKKKEGGG
ncbi:MULTISPECIES: C-terminal binding protein [Thermococcus]|uniref:C-terminal binding protein n=1 Tax=Thermococcus TaxID=2263 RepID=UPI000B34C4B2|nr:MULTISPECIES: C-terminal binding protein [Thermococcus]MCA6214132.1 C-terminal binding protein [Thermococcus bergensis]